MSVDLDAALQEAHRLQEEGAHRDALRVLDNALELTSATPSALLLQAVLAASALEVLTGGTAPALVDRFSRADALATSICPDNKVVRADIKHQLATALHGMRRDDESFNEWLAAASLAREVPDNDEQRSWILLGLVPALLLAKRFQEACALAKEATELKHPHRAQGRQWFMDRMFLGQALAGVGRSHEARAVLVDALAQATADVKEPVLREARELLEALDSEP